MSTKWEKAQRLTLSNDKHTLVDPEDYDFLSQWKWCFDGEYAQRKDSDNRTIRMHTVLCPTPDGLWVDHINGDKLDNRGSNLRAVNPSQSAANTKIKINNTSGYKGVNYEKKRKKWRARIKKNYKQIELGYFSNKSDAIKARKKAERKYFGEYARK